MSKVRPLPGILEHNKNTTRPISAENLPELIMMIRARTGLSQETCQILVEKFFQLLRSMMLSGDIIVFPNFGKFLISSPLTSGTKKQVFPKFHAALKLRKLINKGK